jgi:hypothetical protein
MSNPRHRKLLLEDIQCLKDNKPNDENFVIIENFDFKFEEHSNSERFAKDFVNIYEE